MTLSTGADLLVGAPTPSPLPRSLDVPTDAPALVDRDGRVVTQGELRDRVHDLAGQLPDTATGRRLVHLPLRRDLAGVTAYLATLEAGHVALVTGDERSAAILRRYRPDVRATGRETRPFEPLAEAPRHLLHPDLALLLSTSGSTGSAKLVRLSHDNLLSNAAGIARALRLTSADRAITSLPLHYCFGLSVLHSHLLVGASVVLHEGSVLDPDFWAAVDDGAVSTLAVVPHMVELMESTGALERPHPSLRLVTQAGGRMATDRVVRTAETGRTQGWDLAVMYGQTEATARISILDPSLVPAHPDAVGRPIDRTTVHVDPVPEAAEGTGEIVVRGPGVMLGYADHPDDLALGSMLAELRTGDVGRLDDDGLLHVVGRRSGFVKILGLRVDLNAVEAALETAGLVSCVTGDDDGLRVAVEPQEGEPVVETAGLARRTAAQACGIGVASVSVAVLPLARLDSGKVDRNGCDALVRGSSPQECEDARHRVAGLEGSTTATRVAAALGAVLGDRGIDLTRSFVEQGGDSLSHVSASVLLTDLLGPLPRGWQHKPIGELVAAAERPAGARPRGSAVETSVLLRAIAVLIICGSHADLFRVLGGAHTLLAVAGFNAARFGLSLPTPSARLRSTGRMLIGVAVPTIAVALVGMLTTQRYGWANLAMANWIVGDVTYGFSNELWFIDALVASLLVLTLLLAVPPVARAWRRDPWRVAAAVAVVALVPRFVILHLGDGVLRGIMPTTFWLFAVGAAVAHAGTRHRRLLTFALAAVGGATFFPDDPVRNLTILGGIAFLTFVPEVRVPTRWVPVIGVLAAASLSVYLIQFQVLSWVPTPLGATVAAVAAGCLLWWVSARPVRRLQDLLPLTSRRPPIPAPR